MIDFVKEGRVGDRVKSRDGGDGVIVEIKPYETYTIFVDYIDGQRCYTKDGRFLADDRQPSLMFDNGSVTIDQGSPPNRETEIDWQRVIEEEFLVGKSNGGVKSAVKDRSPLLLSNHDKTKPHPFLMVTKVAFKHVAIPNMKGIRKPHFGGECPCDPEQLVKVKFRKNKWSRNTVKAGDFIWEWREIPLHEDDIMEYIELP